ncbi:hypothetical protein EDD11_003670 [Mortierella claussenii]|nr:hypothetical protein EDD11_003670 [Mortierella claussenii]
MSTKRKDHMNLPEVRALVRKALDINTLITCARVNKAWSLDFVPFVWHTIDLKCQVAIKDIEPDIIAKHGHHIRVLKNICKRSDVDLFMTMTQDNKNSHHHHNNNNHSSRTGAVSKLEHLTVHLKPRSGYQQQLVELIHMNIGTLTTLKLWGNENSEEGTAFRLEDALLGKSHKVKVVNVHGVDNHHVAATATKADEVTSASASATIDAARDIAIATTTAIVTAAGTEPDTVTDTTHMTAVCPVAPQSSPVATPSSSTAREAVRDTATATVTKPAPPPLRYLSIRHMRMSRACFSRILEGCPNLDSIVIRKTTLTDVVQDSEANEGRDRGDHHNYPIQLFQHKGITNMWASVEQVFNPSTEGWTTSPCLLVHFPNLDFWETWSSQYNLVNPSAQEMRHLVARYCDRLERFAINDSASSIAQELLIDGIQNPVSSRLRYRGITPMIIYGLLLHQSTLKKIRTYDPDYSHWGYHDDEVPYVDDWLHDSWMIHMLLSRCPKVVGIELPAHIMDMDVVEQFPWACRGLKELRIRIKGLATKELIMKVIIGWARGVHAKRKDATGSSTSSIGTLRELGDSKARETSQDGAVQALAVSRTQNANENASTRIEEGEEAEAEIEMDEKTKLTVDKAIQHLLKFEKLTTLWLGYKVWTV